MNYNIEIDDTVRTHEDLVKDMYKKVSSGELQVMDEIAMPGVDTRIKPDRAGEK